MVKQKEDYLNKHSAGLKFSHDHSQKSFAITINWYLSSRLVQFYTHGLFILQVSWGSQP